ncbi:uncharacterized protein LOC142476197 [Ascaphus truei]|uniref:uncharacterized protein LOC142476197 n=1 Tax=Ascaphus truei TaxID=8439 RepID=UPI003F5A65BC
MTLVQQSLAPHTWKTYNNTCRQWRSFRKTPKGSVGEAGAAWEVWLIGHSFMYWAREWAASTLGLQLGIPQESRKIRWLGKRGMCWRDLVPTTTSALAVYGRKPHVIMIHLGGNDMVATKSLDVILQIHADCARLKALWNDAVIIWSEIIPRLAWRGARSWVGIEKARREVNRDIRKFMLTCGGLTVNHREFEDRGRRWHRRDGVHMTDEGLDIFIDNILRPLQAISRQGLGSQLGVWGESPVSGLNESTGWRNCQASHHRDTVNTQNGAPPDADEPPGNSPPEKIVRAGGADAGGRSLYPWHQS